MGWFGKKKEEKKKFDHSEETKELFAERDAYYAEQRRKLGGGASNPELANKKQEAEPSSREDDLENLLGGSGDFNPYVNADDSTSSSTPSIPSSQPSTASSSAYSCSSCGKEFQEKWGKCPSCGGEMKKAESPAPENTSRAMPQTDSTQPSAHLMMEKAAQTHQKSYLITLEMSVMTMEAHQQILVLNVQVIVIAREFVKLGK